MVICSRCKKKIDKDKLTKIYQISVGNIIEDQFHGNITYYYHIECLELSIKKNSQNYLQILQ